MNILVIPTNREEQLDDFLDAWQSVFSTIIVIEDNPTKTFKIKDWELHHYAWEDIDQQLGENSWIISRRDSAIRSFGFLMAYHMGAEHIFTLDDDCRPLDDFVKTHIQKLEGQNRWTCSAGRRTRGLPYHNLGRLKNVVLNMGLWEGIPDLDAVQTLAGEDWSVKKGPPDQIIPFDQYFPMCGMNLCFKRQITPLMYFPLMGEISPYKRFDDIWCGIIMKKVCDYLGLLISCGNPTILHIRASDPFINLQKEAPGIAANERFWETIDNLSLSGNSPVQCMKEIGQQLSQNQDNYLQKLGVAIQIWSELFDLKQGLVMN